MTRPAGLLAVALALVAALPAAAQEAEDGLARVKRTGVLRWGCDSQGGAPYVYEDARALGRLIGFEVELADAIAEAMGVRAEPVQNQWSQLVPGLQRGTDFDVAMNGLEVTPDREREVLFSKPYYISTLEVTVRKADAPVPASYLALRGKKVGTLKESLSERELQNAGGIEVVSYEGTTEPYLDLRIGRIQAVVMDGPIARYYGRAADFAWAPAEFGEARYALAAKKAERALVAEIDGALEKLGKSGKLREIYERYGIWNAATAALVGDPAVEARSSPAMLELFERRDAPLSLGGRLGRYGSYLPSLLTGAALSLGLSVSGMAIAVALGLVLALMRVYGGRGLRALSIFYVEAIRGTPLLIQLYFIFYALPQVPVIGVALDPITAAVLGLGLNYAAYEAENYRAGITSIALGQTEAAHALGLTHMQTLRYIIVPQALRLVIPPVTNDFIALLKDSSIVSVITMQELTFRYNSLQNSTGDRIALGLMVGVLYFLLGFPFARLAAHLEARARKGRRLTGG